MKPWAKVGIGCGAVVALASFAQENHALLLSRIGDVERWSLDDVAAPFVTVPR